METTSYQSVPEDSGRIVWYILNHLPEAPPEL
jgi:hypothetical protein